MAITNVIVNGTFAIAGSGSGGGTFGWTGTDIETNPLSSYFGGSSSDRAAEMDGNSGQTTVMQQSFAITEPTSVILTLQAAQRSTSPTGIPGVDGFRVDIVDSSNNVIATALIRPTATALTNYSLSVSFPGAGTYTIRLTEVGNDDSGGTIVDNIALLVCFTAGTVIETIFGPVAVERLKVGDLVKTAHGYQPIRWIGCRSVSAEELRAEPKLRPVRISAGALGGGLPRSDLGVSRQHRMLANGPVVKRMFGCDSALISAIRLTALDGVYVDETVEEVSYFHLLFDRHEVIFANGSPSESLFTGPEALNSLSDAARDEILMLFPELAEQDYAPQAVAVIPDASLQKQLVRRHIAHQKALFQTH